MKLNAIICTISHDYKYEKCKKLINIDLFRGMWYVQIISSEKLARFTRSLLVIYTILSIALLPHLIF